MNLLFVNSLLYVLLFAVPIVLFVRVLYKGTSKRLFVFTLSVLVCVVSMIPLANWRKSILSTYDVRFEHYKFVVKSARACHNCETWDVYDQDGKYYSLPFRQVSVGDSIKQVTQYYVKPSGKRIEGGKFYIQFYKSGNPARRDKKPERSEDEDDSVIPTLMMLYILS